MWGPFSPGQQGCKPLLGPNTGTGGGLGGFRAMLMGGGGGILKAFGDFSVAQRVNTGPDRAAKTRFGRPEWHASHFGKQPFDPHRTHIGLGPGWPCAPPRRGRVGTSKRAWASVRAILRGGSHENWGRCGPPN